MKIQTYRKLNLLFSALIFFLLTNACSRYCAIHHPCVVKDSVTTIVKTRIDTFTAFIEPDSMSFKERIVNDTIILKETDKQSLYLSYQNGYLSGKSTVKPDTVYITKQSVDSVKTVVKVVKPDTIKVTPIWVWFALSFAGTLILLLIIRIIFKR